MSLLDENIDEQSDTNVYNYCWQHWHTTSYKNALQRTFHAVGHGAFYTEKFFGENNELLFCAVYDCGGKDMSAVVQNSFTDKATINLLFISHLHYDHINGVNKLLSYCNVERIVLPALEPNMVVEAILYNYIQSIDFSSSSLTLIERLLNGDLGGTQVTEVDAISSEQSNSKLIGLGGLDKRLSSGATIAVNSKNWLYVPINIQYTSSSSLVKELEKAVGKSAGYFLDGDGRLDYKKVKDVVIQIGVGGCKAIYNTVFGDDHNSYSMPVFSISPKCLDAKCHQLCHRVKYIAKNCYGNCLYMGDFEAKATNPNQNTNYEQFKAVYQAAGIDYRKVGVLQVPHHGSENNRNEELYKSHKLCIISAGIDDRYNHPDASVLCAIQREQSVPIIITEDKKTIQKFFLPY